MKKSPVILTVLALGIAATGIWIFLRPKDTVVIKGYLPQPDVVAIKSLVKKDMRKRLLPDYSWASFQSLVPDLRAYFRYNILEIDSHGTQNTRVEVGDGKTVAGSKHICEYVVRKDAKGWSVVVIFSPSMTKTWLFRTPALLTNRVVPGPFVGATIPRRAVRTDGSNIFSFTNSGLPFPTNLAVPQLTLGGGPASRNLSQPVLPVGGAPSTITNNSTLVLRPPTVGLGGVKTYATPIPPYGSAPPPFRGITMPTSSGTLTNLMPLGK